MVKFFLFIYAGRDEKVAKKWHELLWSVWKGEFEYTFYTMNKSTCKWDIVENEKD